MSGIPYWAITILLKMYVKSFAVDAFLYDLRYAYLVSVSTITSMLSYVVPMRGSFDVGSLVMKSRAIDDYAYSGNVGVCSFS